MTFNPKALLATAAMLGVLHLSLDGELTLLDIVLDTFLTMGGLFAWSADGPRLPAAFRRHLAWRRGTH